MASELERLRAQVARLEQELVEAKEKKDPTPTRSKIEKMSAEVKDTNPYRCNRNNVTKCDRRLLVV